MLWRALTIVLAVAVSVCAFPRNSVNRTPATVVLADETDSEGYPAEVHHVTTEDGYILSIHRIPYGKNGPSEGRKPVVFVMHGLMGSSSNFIFLGSNAGIAYNLADAGYDVWMGNARGNINSRAHVSLNPDDSRDKSKFFDFSWEQIGMIDVPAMVDYALAYTGEEKLHYVGHSQGGTAFLVLNSMKPEYNEKFVSAHLLAGVGYMSNFPNAPLRATARLTNSIYSLGKRLGLVEISSLDDLPISLQGQMESEATYKAYRNMLGLSSILDDSELSALGVGGSALKQFAHYGQNIKDRAFRRWDYGLVENRRVYGSLTPPSYDLSRITVDVTMHYTVSDVLLDERDVLAMAAAMPNTIARKIARKTFSHVDFVQAPDVKEMVTQYIITRLSAIERISA